MEHQGQVDAPAGTVRLRTKGAVASRAFGNELAAAFNSSQSLRHGVVDDDHPPPPVALVFIGETDFGSVGGGMYEGYYESPNDRVIDATQDISGQDFTDVNTTRNACYIANWAEASTSAGDQSLGGSLACFPAVLCGWASSTSDSEVFWPVYHIWARKIEVCSTTP